MRVLFIAGLGSIHVARWVSNLKKTNWDIHLLDPLSGGITPQFPFEKVYLYLPYRYNAIPSYAKVQYFWPFSKGRFFLSKRFPKLWRRIFLEGAERIIYGVKKIRPDVIHALALQYSGYPLADAIQMDPDVFKKIPIIYSSWGNDVYYFRDFPEHKKKIEKSLPMFDYLVTDCIRDIDISKNYGFKGEVLATLPGGGGYDVSGLQIYAQSKIPSKRKIIAIKGYDHERGRANIALKALTLCVNFLSGFEVVVHSPTASIYSLVENLKNLLPCPITILERGTQSNLFRLFGQSRISLGVAVSDGTPNTLLEAMILGAFPIQTDPGGASSEWIKHGVNGLLIPHDDPYKIADALKIAINNDQLVDYARTINFDICKKRIDYPLVQENIISIYEKAYKLGKIQK
jgi:glycosyltransferase involved in cell wall biosynthesis